MLATIIYVIVLIASLGWFAYTMGKRLRLLRWAGSVDRSPQPDQRIAGVFKYVLGQVRLLHGDLAAGIMHFFIFWGFVVVLLNTLHFLIQGPNGDFPLPLLGHDQLLGQVYYVLRDVFELLVLLAVIYALWRRTVTKPKRLELSREALLILAFIGILMITDFLIGGARTAISLDHGWISPAEGIVARLLGQLSAGDIAMIRLVSWWIHLITLMVFLNLLPLGKHFHVLLSIPGVYLRRLTPFGELNKIDFENEDLEVYGASELKHLSWKNWLDAYNCTECGRCDYYCPANSTGKALSPRHILIGTRDRIYGSQPQILKALAAKADDPAREFESELPALVGEIHTDQQLWACTTCGACDTHCPVLLEHVEPIVNMRRHLVLEEEGRFPKELVATFKGLETQGNPWSIGAHQRLEWAEGLEVPTLSDKPDAEYVYFVGCFASLDERNKATARALVELLNHAGVCFAVLDAESCCGDPARRCGNEYLAQALIEMNAEQFKDGKVKKVFTSCPHCFNTLKHEYAQFGVEFAEVLHHSELLVRLMRERKLVPQHQGEARAVVFHDSCYLGRYNEIYNEPRQLLQAIGDIKLREGSFHHDKGYCCGAGGGMMFMEELEGTRVNQFRIEQLAAAKPDLVAVACPFCMTMLDDAVKETGRENLPVRDIALVLRDAVLGKA
ncbi:(Fe-S)-binding protein [bacterium]|nr:(Fe-S)-binding protein [bacterium]